jgi:hypothetical protein
MVSLLNCSLQDRKNQFECSIVYRLLLLMGARYFEVERCRKATGLQIPTHSGQVFRIDAGRDSDLKPATIPN